MDMKHLARRMAAIAAPVLFVPVLAWAAANLNTVAVGSQSGIAMQGTAANLTYLVTTAGTGSGSITWSVSGLPSGVSGYFTATTTSVGGGWGSLSTTLTIRTAATTAANTYPFTVTATGNSGLSNTGTLTVSNVDTTPPSVSAAHIASNNANTARAKVGDTVTLTFTASEAVRTPVVTIAGHSVSAATTTGNSFTASYVMTSGDAEGAVPFSVTLTDTSGNPASAVTATTDASSVTFDKTAPVVAPHATETVEASGASGATVTYTKPSATDAIDGAVSVSCAPASGGVFAIGNTTVTCTATDAAGNTGTNTFTVTVQDTTPPSIAAHADAVAEATGASGAIVTYTAPATSDAVDGAGTAACLPASGSTFTIASTTVTCTITDAHGNSASSSFVVGVYDTTAPAFSGVPADISASAADASGATVTYTAPTATDAVDITDTVSCSPISGSTFPIGNDTVTCTATDAHGNTGTLSFHIVVSDTTGPVLALSSDMTVEATSAAGASVTFTASASDAVDGSITPVCTPASGSAFALGPTTVTCAATDAANNTTSSAFTITVTDTTAPAIATVADMTVDATSEAGAIVTYTTPGATDAVDGTDTVACTPVSGSTFAIGNTTVTCTSDDAARNTGTSSFTVSVADGSASLRGITTEQGRATADDTYVNGWRWTFHLTLPFSETQLALKFADFTSGADSIPVADNMRYYTPQASAASTTDASVTVSGADTYPTAITLDGDDDSRTPGRQADVIIEMKIPAGTPGGVYTSSYGIRSDVPSGGGSGSGRGGFSGGGPF